MIKKVGAIAIAVRDVEAAAETAMKFLGGEKQLEYELPQVGIEKSILLRIGNVYYELIQPSAMDSPLRKFIETRGEGIFQLAVLSDNIDQEVETLKQKGARVSKMVIDEEKNIISGYISPKSLNGVTVEITSEDSWPYNILPPLS